MVVFEGVAYVLWLAPINIGLDKQQAKRRDFINIGLNKATFHGHDMKVKKKYFLFPLSTKTIGLTNKRKLHKN